MRLDSLTSLRFAAAFLVFGFHATSLLQEPSRRLSSVLFGAGHAGVSFFFILSGFVLAWSYRRNDTIVAFYRRRFARLYPVYFVSLCACAALLFATGNFGQLAKGLLAPFMLQAWVPDSSYYFAINTVAWSLSVEAFFYLMFPFVIGKMFRLSQAGRAALASVMVVAIVTLGLYGQATLGDGVFREEGAVAWFVKTFPVSRFPEFVIGVLLAIQMRQGKFIDIGAMKAFGLAILACLLIGVFPSILGFVVIPLVPFVLLIAAVSFSDIQGRSSWLRHRSLISLGAWSYCFYLVHVLVIRVLADGLYHLGYSSGEPTDGTTQPLPLGGWSVWGAALGLSVLAAWLLHKYVELPMDRKLRSRETTAGVGI